MRILPLIILVACVACEAAARAQDDERPAPRGLPKRNLLKGKTTTTTTPAPQEEEAEYEEYGEGDEAGEPSTEAPPSSTEGKKLVGGGVRPFRSNTDLLEALKRRRAQAAEAKLHAHSHAQSAAPAQDTPPETPPPAKSSYNTRKSRLGRVEPPPPPPPAPAQRPLDAQNNPTNPSRRRQPNTRESDAKKKSIGLNLESKTERPRTISRNGRQRPTMTYDEKSQWTTSYPRKTLQNEIIDKKRFNTAPKESHNEEAGAPVKPSRSRFGRPSSRSVQDEPEEQNESAPAPIRTGRTFSRRN